MTEILRATNEKGDFLEPVKPADGKSFTAKEVMEIVGGYYGQLTLRNGDVMYFDDEGPLREKPLNTFATRLARLGKPAGTLVFNIFGDVLVCDEEHRIRG